ncbi:hypothetical protein [Vannielia litorea]|uniref:Uncharacterized protein n=1 Tax=Vannielia litorea TaxID=1217970 RepID=A0A1N6F9G6_9RHOB|nr:hypothetical protein [Vannielia litorea]SIN91890.1 hypothetical protein SAMN05444002_1488 [Vannielia litorea]
MLKSQRHYYWIGGGIWGLLMLVGIGFVVYSSLQGKGSGLADALSTEVFAQSEVVTGDAAAQGVLLTDAGEVDIGPGGLTLTDPLTDPDRPAFDLDTPEGRFPALIYRPADDPRVIGMVALRFSDAPVGKWKRAGRKGRPLDFEFTPDDIVALGDSDAVAALEAEAVSAALAAATGPVRHATLEAEGRAVLLLDPSFETFSADIYVGFDENGDPAVLVKDFGYFGTRAALDERAETGE